MISVSRLRYGLGSDGKPVARLPQGRGRGGCPMRAELKPLAHLNGLQGHFLLFLRREEAAAISALPGHGVTMTGLVQVFLKKKK